MIFDALTFCKTWIDDNRFVIPSVHLLSAYEKGNPHVILEIEVLEKPLQNETKKKKTKK